MRVEHPMTRVVVFVQPSVSLREAWQIMTTMHIRHLPVVEEGILRGIVSDRDLLLRARLDGTHVDVPDQPVSSAMSPAPYVCAPDTSVADVVRTMTERKIDAMPVLDASDRMVGLVTSTDLMLLLIELDEIQPLPFDFQLEERGQRALA